ncbi:hypothetical protein [Hyphococcus sp.]|jgi:hypothetical protein|uniref:hypothetical protein n=1 Tax=Hyphococcus sp. TaxID=2038636 RepID=UPI003D0E1D39
MKILIVILTFLTGLALIAYSYISAFIRLAELTGDDLDAGNPFGAIDRVMAFMNSGEVPQMMNFLYLGAFVIALGVFYMFFGGSRKANDE